MTKSNIKVNRYICLLVFVLCSLAMLACELFKTDIFGSGDNAELYYSITSRIFGTLLSVFLVFYCGFKGILKFGFSPILKGLLTVIPCWIIAINNFPIIPVALGQSRVTANKETIFLFAISCLFVGVFEELAYRGCVFMLVLKGMRKTKKDIFKAIIISSALFGCVHLVNLFVGAGPTGVILQVGYSFLIGAMCSFVLIKTGSVWHCALIHAVYNFCGGIVSTYGVGEIWTVPEVILTVIVSIAVIVYVVASLCKTDPKETDCLF